MSRQDRHWTLDRRVPVAVIVTLFMQLAAALIWATELDARVASIESQNIGSANWNEKFARLEERMENMRQDTQSIKRRLDYLIERMIRK